MDVAQLDRKIYEDNILTRLRLATNYSTIPSLKLKRLKRNRCEKPSNNSFPLVHAKGSHHVLRRKRSYSWRRISFARRQGMFVCLMFTYILCEVHFRSSCDSPFVFLVGVIGFALGLARHPITSWLLETV